jgi:hypothetical protein
VVPEPLCRTNGENKLNLFENQYLVQNGGAGEFVLWMLLVIVVGILIGMREDKNGRGR